MPFPETLRWTESPPPLEGREVYRAQSPASVLTAASPGSILCELWVPASAFRIGTRIEASAQSATASSILTIFVGGQIGSVSTTLGTGGTTVATQTGGAIAGMHLLRATQETDGMAVSFRSGGAFVAATTAMLTAVATTGVPIPPLTVVKLVGVGAFTWTNARLEVIPASYMSQPGGYGAI